MAWRAFQCLERHLKIKCIIIFIIFELCDSTEWKERVDVHGGVKKKKGVDNFQAWFDLCKSKAVSFLYVLLGLFRPRKSALSLFFSVCVRCGFGFKTQVPGGAGKGQEKKKKARKMCAAFHNVFKYYPKLKDIHTKFSSLSGFSSWLLPGVSTVAGVGLLPWRRGEEQHN